MRQLFDTGLFTDGFGISTSFALLVVWFVFFVILDNCFICWDSEY